MARHTPHRESMLVVPLVGSSLIALVSAAAAAGPYPDEPPDFAHPDDPHSELFSPTGGTTDRPMLVIYPEFSDLTYDDTSPPGLDAAYMSDRFFGGFPSVADYHGDDSGGRLLLTPASDTDTSNNGAVDDGVVSVTIDETKDDFINWEDPDWAQQTRICWRLRHRTSTSPPSTATATGGSPTTSWPWSAWMGTLAQSLRARAPRIP